MDEDDNWQDDDKAMDQVLFLIIILIFSSPLALRFWHDPWSGPTPLKELYPELFACAVVQEALISDMVISAPDRGGRSWNFLFRRNFNEWEMRRFYSFYEHVSARIPSGEGEDTLIW